MLARRYIKKYKGRALAILLAVAIFSGSYIAMYSTIETFVNTLNLEIKKELQGTQLIVSGEFTLDSILYILSRPEVTNVDIGEGAFVAVQRPNSTSLWLAYAAFFFPNGIFGSKFNLTSNDTISISDFFSRYYSVGDTMNVTIFLGDNQRITETFTVGNTYIFNRTLLRSFRFDLVLPAQYYFEHISKYVYEIYISCSDKEVVKEKLSKLSYVDDVYDIEEELEKNTEEIRNEIQGLDFINLFIGLLGVILIAGTFYISIDERRKEIAVLRAMGASGFTIAKEFLLEATILGLLGRLVGIALAIPLSYAGASLLMSLLKQFGYEITISSVYISTVDVYESLWRSVLLTVIGASIPLFNALRIRPIEAMRPPMIFISGFPIKSLAFASLFGALAAITYLYHGFNRETYYFIIIALALALIVMLRIADKAIGKLLVKIGTARYVGARLTNIHVKRTVMVALLVGITVGTAVPTIASGQMRKKYIDDFSSFFNYQLLVSLPVPLNEVEASGLAAQAKQAGATSVAFYVFGSYYTDITIGNTSYAYEYFLMALLNDNIFDYYNFEIINGTADLSDFHVVVSDKFAEAYNVSIGDPIEIAYNNQTQVGIVSGIFKYREFMTRLGREPNTIILSPDLARLLGMDQYILELLIKAPEDKIDNIKNSIMDIVGPIVGVWEISDVIGIAKRIYTVIMAFFAALMIFFLTIALLSIYVTSRQMSYELRGIAGMLRAMGASKRTTLGTFIVAMVTMVLMGLIPVLLLSYPISKLMWSTTAVEIDLDFVYPINYILLIVVGIALITAAIAYLSTRRLSKKGIIDLTRY